MGRSAKQKLKLLYLKDIMLKKTDEEHPLTIQEIKAELARYGVSAERKSLYDDLRALEDYGLDICTVRSTTVKYYIGSREFELAELKLLVDAIQSSRFITQKKTLKLINKLEELVSEHDAKQLLREVYLTNRVKNRNEKIYYNIDKLHTAIQLNKKIKFSYYSWELDFENTKRIVKKKRHSGRLYCQSPLALCWDDENYYLVAFDSEAAVINHFRVDKMESVQVTDEDCESNSETEGFDPAKYAKGVFSMFGGESATVKLLVDNSLIGVIVDRFDENIVIVRESDSRFFVSLNVTLSPQFYAWLFGLGDKVRIISPQKAIQEYNSRLEDVKKVYCADGTELESEKNP